jgi:E3 ubiquitin-protein ligase HUWE1
LIEKQVQAFLKGFYAIVPKEMIFVYSEEELEQLLCGRPDISIQELRESAQYKGGWSKDDEQIKWLWEFLGTRKRNFRTA